MAAGAFRVGVTGHRDLADSEALVAPVDAALDAAEGDAGDLPLELVSSLAEGADRLVADRALARAGWTLRVILPLPAREYEHDFPESVDAFRALVDRAVALTVVPPAASRPDAYLAAGHAVVEASDLLVAVWDGQPAGGTGGTAEVVAAAHGAHVPVIVIPAARTVRT